MRRGSITECYRCCGKVTCACAGAAHPGHGPYDAFTPKVDGKTKTLQLRAGPFLTKIAREVQTHREFRATCDHLIEVNEVIERATRRRAMPGAAHAVERRFNADTSEHTGATLPCPCGKRARYAGRRPKTVETAVGPLTIERAPQF